MSMALATGGGGTAARDAASARSASRALCGVMVVASRSGSSGMIWATTGSSGVVMRASSDSVLRHCEERSDEAIQSFLGDDTGLLRFARNDGAHSMSDNLRHLGRR